MIFSSRRDYKILEQLGINFKKAYNFLLNNDLHQLKYGQTFIDGTNVSVIKEEYDTKPIVDAYGTSHKKYAIVTLVLAGEEYIGYADIDDEAKYKDIKDYDEDLDEYSYQLGKCSLLLLDSSNFCVFFPNDVYMPSISTAKNPIKVIKITFKIRLW